MRTAFFWLDEAVSRCVRVGQGSNPTFRELRYEYRELPINNINMLILNDIILVIDLILHRIILDTRPESCIFRSNRNFSEEHSHDIRRPGQSD
jgi:hypothetical protein